VITVTDVKVRDACDACGSCDVNIVVMAVIVVCAGDDVMEQRSYSNS
jgi:hypothetical protein